MKTAALLALTLSASAQSFSSHSGWNFTDTLQTATDVLVADITGGSAVDDGSEVRVKATLQAVRILSGDINAGAAFVVEWHYRPNPGESPAVTTKVPLARGLWFLRKDSNGTFEPMQAGMMSPMGNSFLPLGDSTPSYADAEPLQTKVAREIAAALEELATEHAADLGTDRRLPGGGWIWPASKAHAQYQSLTMALHSLKEPATADVYRFLSALSDPNLKALGIFGRLENGDVSAVFDLENNLTTVLSSGVHPMLFPPLLDRLDLKANLPAAHALARIALSDSTVQGLDGRLAIVLARTRSPEMLPYLIVMLGSPEPGIRGSALVSFGFLLGPRPEPSALWTPEMAGYCPTGFPVNDREVEQKDIQFWTQWWESHRKEIAKTVALPNVTAPARYGAARREEAEIPIEVRFEFLLHMAADKQPEHYHAADGTIVEAPPPFPDGPHDPVSGQLEAADREIFDQVIASVNTKLAAIQERGRQIANAARITGVMPTREQSRELGASRSAALQTGLAELQTKLSPEGWQTVEHFLKPTGAAAVGAASSVMVTSPRKTSPPEK
jgi:hypothetical protein